MKLTAEQVAHCYHTYKERLTDRHARMREVSDVYNGRTELPLPELNKNEKAAVPNLTQLGTDQIARRIASVIPTITYPSTMPGAKAAEDRADLRRQVNYGWWQLSKMRKLQAQRSRWLVTYASAPAVIRPDPTLRVPVWELHSPFNVFPGPRPHGSFTPDDAVIRHQRHYRWLMDRYPEAMMRVRKKRDVADHDCFDVLEHWNDEWCTFVVVGQERHERDDYMGMAVGTPSEVLTQLPNRAGMCPVVIPERTGLDAPVGQFDTILGMYATEAIMTALSIIAARRAIWPVTWAVNPNGALVPSIVQNPDPETGTPGVITNGILDRQQLDPSFAAQNTIDRLQAAQRQTAALPPELGGTGGENVRTGRRGSQIMSASIDFTIAEGQDALAEALHDENERAIAVDRNYFNTTKSFYVSTKGARGKVRYKPSEIWDDSTEHIVEYPIAGTDLSDLVINAGQRVGMGTMSKRSFMEVDPLVSDADAEESRVRLEQAEQAFFAAFQEQMASPDAPWQAEQVADFAMRMARGDKWYEAVAAINKELQEKQAEGAQPGTPEAQPGLAPLGAPGEIPTIGAPAPSMNNLTQLLGQLGTAQQAMAFR